MSADLQTSIILITSSEPTNGSFGTGFIIHKDEQAVYLLTCAHVVEDLGGPDNVQVPSICVHYTSHQMRNFLNG
jgi:hypothetical protein